MEDLEVESIGLNINSMEIMKIKEVVGKKASVYWREEIFKALRNKSKVQKT